MTSTALFAEIAALAGDPARASMLHALMDGRALTASELAYRLVTLGAVTQPGILGLGKLLDSGSAGRLLAAALGDEEALSRQGEELTLRGPCGGAALDRASLQALLFGGPEVRDEVRAFLSRVGFSRARLPLEPFAFGLDSI